MVGDDPGLSTPEGAVGLVEQSQVGVMRGAQESGSHCLLLNGPRHCTSSRVRWALLSPYERTEAFA